MIQKGKGEKAILMLHGRGGNAEDILRLSNFFDTTSYAFTAENSAWYPYSFMRLKKKKRARFK